MTTGIACFIAGICAAGFITIWFSTAYRELSERRGNLEGLRKQLQMHQHASAQVRDGPEREVALKMLSTNRRIFQEAVCSYNQLLKQPMIYLPALLLGFRPVDDS